MSSALKPVLALVDVARGERAAAVGAGLLEHQHRLDGDVTIAGAKDVVGAEMDLGLDVGEERAEQILLIAQDRQGLEQERSLALDADRGLLAVAAVLLAP